MLRAETYKTKYGNAYRIFFDDVEIGAVALIHSRKGEKRRWKNVCWATGLGHEGFKNRLEAIYDLYHLHMGLVTQHDNGTRLDSRIH